MRCEPGKLCKVYSLVSDPPNFKDFKKAGIRWLGIDAYKDYVNQYET